MGRHTKKMASTTIFGRKGLSSLIFLIGVIYMLVIVWMLCMLRKMYVIVWLAHCLTLKARQKMV